MMDKERKGYIIEYKLGIREPMQKYAKHNVSSVTMEKVLPKIDVNAKLPVPTSLARTHFSLNRSPRTHLLLTLHRPSRQANQRRQRSHRNSSRHHSKGVRSSLRLKLKLRTTLLLCS